MNNNRRIPIFNYRDPKSLGRYVDIYGRIDSRQKTGLSAKQQKKLATAIKRARHIGVLPFVASN